MSTIILTDPNDPVAADGGLHQYEEKNWNDLGSGMFVTDKGLDDLHRMAADGGLAQRHTPLSDETFDEWCREVLDLPGAPQESDRCSEDNPCLSLEWNGGPCKIHRMKHNTSSMGKLVIPIITHQGIRDKLVSKRFYRIVHTKARDGVTGIWIEESDSFDGPWTIQYAGDVPRVVFEG